MQLSVKAYAKINWSLSIVDVRSDGYHELDMLMQSLELCDELSFAPSRMLTLSVNGKPLPKDGRNLVLRAANALREYAGVRGGAKINLVKRIPVRAGLGGGSADCAATLLALNRLWRVNLTLESLMKLGATLGADVPFCLQNGIARVHGIGEKLEPLPPPPPVSLVLITPGPGLSTASVFAAWDENGYEKDPSDTDAAYRALRERRYGDLASHCRNSLEAPATAMLPEIASVKKALLCAGARFAQMSGSGSTVFGVFDTPRAAEAAAEAIGPEALVTATRGE